MDGGDVLAQCAERHGVAMTVVPLADGLGSGVAALRRVIFTEVTRNAGGGNVIERN